MEQTELYQLKFPIGEFTKLAIIDSPLVESWINDIATFPNRITTLTKHLSETELNLTYRSNGWSIKQVVHHCADSHMNSFIRFKLALTENSPTIKPYFEDRWAELTDSIDNNITDSLTLITALHSKWVVILKNLSSTDLKKEFIHPEHGKRISIEENIGIYAWHCNHHLAHIHLALKHKVEG